MSADTINNKNRIAGYGRLALKPVRFTYDGKTYEGLEGDTLASALIANDVHLAGRSFKYHRPRGFLSAGNEEPNAIMNIKRDEARQQPNVRATVQELYDGLEAESQNRWPNLSYDVGVINDGLSKFFPAGFYYKTFMWPKKAWDKLYEPIIRGAAGLGKAPHQEDTDYYTNQYAHCDFLIIGGSVAGIRAALRASKTGKRVIFVDENREFGGAALWDGQVKFDGMPAYDWVQEKIAELAACENVTLLNRTTAFGYYAQNMVALTQRLTEHQSKVDENSPRERLWQVRAKQVILATGAIERAMVFHNNDRPGIMLADSARQYLHKYGVSVGKKVAIYTACDSAYQAAFDLKRAGVRVPAIIDVRDTIADELLDEADNLGINVLKGSAVIDTKGRLRVSSITVVKITDDSVKKAYDVDALLTSSGWTPSVHLFSQSRGKLKFDQTAQVFLPDVYAQECQSIGACNGTMDYSAAFLEADEAIKTAAKKIGAKLSTSGKAVAVEGESPNQGGMLGGALSADLLSEKLKPAKAFIDYQNDVTSKDVRLAVREGFHSIEHVKRYTTTGMATDQGKISNMHGLAIAAEVLGKEIPEVGLTTFRAPYTPVTFGTIANHSHGELFDPTRKTPIHDWAVKNGAVFEDVGNWKRAWYFPQSGEDMHAAVDRECVATRKSAGIFDASTLGKIEVVGKDAAEFMNLMYVNAWSKLAVGRSRYGIMCREDGFIYDDGVVGRISQDRFHVTTTTGGAPRVLAHMEDHLQTEFPHLDVHLTSTSEQWAVVAVNGPNARKIIEGLVEMDISNEAFPHMSVAETKIAGIDGRLFRLSFTGELGYEINVPAHYGKALWEALMEAGKPYNITPYGTETMHVLRAEKGFIIVGQDTDGTVTPQDAALGWAIGKKKSDFVGYRGMQRKDLVAPNRRQLVGLKVLDGKTVLEEGAQVTREAVLQIPMPMVGFVTSSYWSENLSKPIAMALIEGGAERMGEKFYVSQIKGDETTLIPVEICSASFYDPKMERVHD